MSVDVASTREERLEQVLTGEALDFVGELHARLEPRRDGIWLEDSGSTNGTYVNGVRVSQPRKLVPGDIVRVGETDLRFET